MPLCFSRGGVGGGGRAFPWGGGPSSSPATKIYQNMTQYTLFSPFSFNLNTQTVFLTLLNPAQGIKGRGREGGLGRDARGGRFNKHIIILNMKTCCIITNSIHNSEQKNTLPKTICYLIKRVLNLKCRQKTQKKGIGHQQTSWSLVHKCITPCIFYL